MSPRVLFAVAAALALAACSDDPAECSGADCGSPCGNGVLDDGELCDGDCPTACIDPADPCLRAALTGSAETCDAACPAALEPLQECSAEPDGCCPAAPADCGAGNDADCAALCGNGALDAGESCDGDCPAACDDGNDCTEDSLAGAAATCDAACTSAPKTTCANGDGCCPAGCLAETDTDCGSDCRNPATWPSSWVAFEDRVLVLVNDERSRQQDCGGRIRAPAGPLTGNELLREAARCHSLDMGKRNFFDHVNPDGDDPFVRIDATGYSSRTQGENIAVGQTSAEEVVAGWMNSPGHCNNIMEGAFDELGVGFAEVQRSRYRFYWTQNFGGN